MKRWNQYLTWVTNREDAGKRTYLIWGISFGLIAVLWAFSTAREYSAVGFHWRVAAGIFIVLLSMFTSVVRLCQYFNYKTLKQAQDSLGGTKP